MVGGGGWEVSRGIAQTLLWDGLQSAPSPRCLPLGCASAAEVTSLWQVTPGA